MKEEVRRIIKLVQEGKLSPEDAADLIDAFTVSEQQGGEARAGDSQATAEAQEPSADTGKTATATKDPLKSVAEAIERIGKEASEAVNWTEVAKQARTSAQKGFEALKSGIEQVSKGKVDFGWFGAQESREISLPLVVPEGKLLRIENPCGSVKVVGGFDVGTATARARFRGANLEDARSKAEAYTLIIEESEHLVSIRQPDVTGLMVDLEVQLQGHATVEVRSESGDVQVLDTKGGARITNQSGDVRLRGLNGLVEVHASSGDISIEDTQSPSLSLETKSGSLVLLRIDGNMNARSASGNIRVEASHGKSIAIESVSGDVTIDLDAPVTGVLNVRTVSGNALVAVPDGCDCRVTLSTLRGEVSCSMPLEDESRVEQQVKGRLGDGTGTLDASAVTGHITLEMHDSA